MVKNEMAKNVKLGRLEDIGIWKHADQSGNAYFVSEHFDVPDIGDHIGWCSLRTRITRRATTRHTTRRCLSRIQIPMREQAWLTLSLSRNHAATQPLMG